MCIGAPRRRVLIQAGMTACPSLHPAFQPSSALSGQARWCTNGRVPHCSDFMTGLPAARCGKVSKRTVAYHMLQHDLSGKETGIAWRKVLEEVDVGVHGYLYVAELLGFEVLR